MDDVLGKIVLMGSGEFTSTMVEVHKALLAPHGPAARAVFLDTPAGFELNVDEIAARAKAYFAHRVRRPLEVASWKSVAHGDGFEGRRALTTLEAAHYVLVGPGSPTYAVRQWAGSPIPALFEGLVRRGGVFVAASAAALTVGRLTVPVYEVYKVGEEVGWTPGIDLLGRFGLGLAVVPHWNNAEGGTHDTRFCYMGEARFRVLEAALPEGVGVLGLDEHTACLMDLAAERVSVRGIGGVTLRRQGLERRFPSGETFPLGILKGEQGAGTAVAETVGPAKSQGFVDPFWDRIHNLERRFEAGLAADDPARAAGALLDLDGHLWQARATHPDAGAIADGRELLREMIVALGSRLDRRSASAEGCLAPLVSALLDLRRRLRDRSEYEAADGIRDALVSAGIRVEDTPEGHRWSLEK